MPDLDVREFVVTSRADIKTLVREFMEAMKEHRHFDRADKQVPA